jgi:hypothetical protein
MLAKELQHVILKTISNLARVSSLVLFKGVRDSVLNKYVMQFGYVASQAILVTNIESDTSILTKTRYVLIHKSQRCIGCPPS